MISLETQSTQNSYYEASFNAPRTGVENLIEEIQKGNHHAVIEYLREGGSITDRSSYNPSLACYCFQYLEPSQFKEILSLLPQDTELPWDTITISENGEQIERVEELLLDLEKFHYPFEADYESSLRQGYFKWIEFFLEKEIPSLDLNCLVRNDEHMTIRPYTHMKIFAGRIFVYQLIANSINEENFNLINESDLDWKDVEKAKEEVIHLSDQIEQILHKMEHHPKIDFDCVQDEMDLLRAKGFHFIGDPELERGCRLIAEAMTFEGLERQVAQGFNLYEPLGSFFAIPLWLEDDSTWIEYFSPTYGEYELVELMAKYQPQL